MTDPDPEVWWGRHPTEGWIAVDRRIPGNTGASTVLATRLSDCQSFKMTKKDWHTCQHVDHALVLATECDRADFSRLSTAYMERRYDLLAQAMLPEYEQRRSAHTALNARFRVRTGEVVATQWNAGWSIPCWNCDHRATSGNVVWKCSKCGWFVCRCGACRCAYYKHVFGD